MGTRVLWVFLWSPIQTANGLYKYIVFLKSLGSDSTSVTSVFILIKQCPDLGCNRGALYSVLNPVTAIFNHRLVPCGRQR